MKPLHLILVSLFLSPLLHAITDSFECSAIVTNEKNKPIYSWYQNPDVLRRDALPSASDPEGVTETFGSFQQTALFDGSKKRLDIGLMYQYVVKHGTNGIEKAVQFTCIGGGYQYEHGKSSVQCPYYSPQFALQPNDVFQPVNADGGYPEFTSQEISPLKIDIKGDNGSERHITVTCKYTGF